MIDYKSARAGVIEAPVCQGSAAYQALMSQFQVSLAGPVQTSTGLSDNITFPFWFKDPPAFSKPGLSAPDCAYFGLAVMTRETAIALIQDSLFAIIDKSFGYKAVGATPGVYDCVTSQLMVLGAQLALKQGVGDRKTYPLDGPMFTYYMTQSAKFQALVKGGVAASLPAAKAKGITWLDNAGQAIVPPPDMTLGSMFVQAPEPTNCAPLASPPPKPGDGTTTTSTEDGKTYLQKHPWVLPTTLVAAGAGGIGIWMWHRSRKAAAL